MTRRYEVDPSRLCIELTETTVMADPEDIAAKRGKLLSDILD